MEARQGRVTDDFCARRRNDFSTLWSISRWFSGCVEHSEKRGLRRAGAPSTINPTRRLGGPSFKCLSTLSAPMKSAASLRSLPTPYTDKPNEQVRKLSKDIPMTHVNPASTGVVSSSRSCPYKHMPASRRKLSRAPRPVSCTGSLESSCATSTVCDGGIEI